MSYKVLVTGGAGYLGSIMVPDLLKAGHKVTVLDNFMFKQDSLNHCCYNPNFSVVKGDVRQKSTMAKLLKSADVIIPLAALVGAPLFNDYFLPIPPFGYIKSCNSLIISLSAI